MDEADRTAESCKLSVGEPALSPPVSFYRSQPKCRLWCPHDVMLMMVAEVINATTLN